MGDMLRKMRAKLGEWLGYRAALDGDDMGKIEEMASLFHSHKAAFAELEAAIDGLVISPVMLEEYNHQRRRAYFFNDAGYPVCIIVVSNVAEIQKVVTWISNRQALAEIGLAVAAGGHSCMAFPDGAIVVDLSMLKHVEVDVASETVSVGAGCKIVDVDKALVGTGLGFVTGTNTDIGVCGLTLSGGIGWLSREFGFACDNLISVEIVLPSGKLVVATDDNEFSDLMKGLRGGSGNFGVVTQLTLKLHRISSNFGGWSVRLAPTSASAASLCKTWRDSVDKLPDECMSWLVFPCGAPVTICMANMHGKQVENANKYTDVEELKWVSQLGGWMELDNNFAIRQYHTELQTLVEQKASRRFTTMSSCALASLDDDLIEDLIRLIRQEYNSRNSTVVVFRLGGKMSSTDPNRSVLTMRKAEYWILIQGSYDRYDLPEHVAGAREWVQRVKSLCSSHKSYDLEHPLEDGYTFHVQGSAHEAYRGANKTFLQTVKTKYDPSNLLRYNKNILPLRSANTAQA